MFDFFNNGSIVLIVPEDEAAREHADEVFGEDALRWGEAIACEPRYAMENARQLLADGFRVRFDGREAAAIEPA